MFLTLLTIIIAGGALGGLVRVALAPETETPKPGRAVIAGIGAAVLVPLFLQTVSSDLLSTILKAANATAALRELLIFGGFCVLAGITAQRFIDTLSSSILKQLEEVKQKAKENSQRIDSVKEEVVAADAKADAAHDAARFGTIDKGIEETGGAAVSVKPGPDKTDPWKGAFGGSPSDKGRILEATITPQSPDWEAATVTLRVHATDPQKPLTGAVQFFLHPTFGESRPVVPVVGGEARLSLLCYGAFTVGALADDGATSLELDLSDHPDARSPWKDR